MTDTPDLRALVTGASSGIGAAYARGLRARGERVVLVARRADRLRSLDQRARRRAPRPRPSVRPRCVGSGRDAAQRRGSPREFLDVAETHRGLLVTRMPMMTAEAVVRASLEGLDRGRVRVVAGWPNRVLGFVVQRLAPRGLARRVAAELYRPREGKKE